MSKSFKTFIKHTAKDYHNQSVNPPIVRASTIIFKTMQDIRKIWVTQKNIGAEENRALKKEELKEKIRKNNFF